MGAYRITTDFLERFAWLHKPEFSPVTLVSRSHRQRDHFLCTNAITSVGLYRFAIVSGPIVTSAIPVSVREMYRGPLMPQNGFRLPPQNLRLLTSPASKAHAALTSDDSSVLFPTRLLAVRHFWPDTCFVICIFPYPAVVALIATDRIELTSPTIRSWYSIRRSINPVPHRTH